MKVFIITGSHRNPSQSAKVGRFIKSRILELGLATDVFLTDIADMHLPYWDSSFWDQTEEWQGIVGEIFTEVTAADGIIVISPEWGGMVPPKLKNFFLLCSEKELGHKPGLIVGVSANAGGAYPVNELRTTSYKNNKLCYIPDHLIIRDAANVLNDIDMIQGAQDEYYRKRIDYTLQVFAEYMKAFRGIRNNDFVWKREYRFGM